MRIRRTLAVILTLFVVAAVSMVAWDTLKVSESPQTAAANVAATRVDPPSAPAPANAAAAAPAEAEKPLAVVEAPPATKPTVEKRPAPVAVAPASVSAPAHKVVATYFHGNIRCATCRKVEAYAREAVEQGFAREIADGTVEFRAVNVEEPHNEHFISDFQLTSKSVVVTDETDGVVQRWVKLDDVWRLVGDHDAYLTYVQDGVRGYMEPH